MSGGSININRTSGTTAIVFNALIARGNANAVISSGQVAATGTGGTLNALRSEENGIIAVNSSATITGERVIGDVLTNTTTRIMNSIIFNYNSGTHLAHTTSGISLNPWLKPSKQARGRFVCFFCILSNRCHFVHIRIVYQVSYRA